MMRFTSRCLWDEEGQLCGRIGGSVARQFLQGSMVWLLAPVTRLLFPAGLRRPGAEGRVCKAVCTHCIQEH